MKIKNTVEMQKRYALVQDAYSGDRGFANGDYLFEYTKEVDFDERKSMAAYSGFIKPIVDARVDPVFIDDAKRVYSNDVIEGFVDNADNNGTTLQEMTHGATTDTVLLGNSFLVVDNFPENQIPKTQADVIKQRKYPYIYQKDVSDVCDYDTDDFGKLTEITFFYGLISTKDKNGKAEVVPLYKKFTETQTIHFTLKDKDCKDFVSGKNSTVTIATVTHDLGVVPVAYYNKVVLPFAPYYSMSTTARKIYNESSEIDDLRRAQAFAILLLPSIAPGQGSQDNLVVGMHNALYYDSQATNVPSYISPDSATLKGLIENRKEDEQTLIQSADVLGTTAISTGNSAGSGIAESYRFFGKKYALLESSGIAKDLEEQVITIVGLYLQKDIEYEVTYPSSFAPTFAETTAKIAALKEIIDMNISDYVTARAEADIVDLVSEFMKWDKDDVEKAKTSIVEVKQIV